MTNDQTTLPASYILDFDSTLITVEALDELASLALANDSNGEKKLVQLKEITDLGMNGQIGFGESLERRMKLLNITRGQLDQFSQDLADSISPSALRQQPWFERERDNIYIVSGGFEEYIKPLVERLGIDEAHVYANRFIYDTVGNVIGYDTRRPTAQAGGKSRQVRDLDLLGRVVVIGDGYTDYEIKQSGAADEFWAYTETTSRSKVTAVADRVVKSFDDIAR